MKKIVGDRRGVQCLSMAITYPRKFYLFALASYSTTSNLQIVNAQQLPHFTPRA